jgi:hypothetical protein
MSEGDVVSGDHKLPKVKHDQDFALELIIGEQSELALSLLENTDKDLQAYEGSFEWARQPFLVARAYAVKHERPAEFFFKEALRRKSKLSACDPHHSLLVHKSFGRYLFETSKFREALKQYEAAEVVAMALGPSEELDQLQLRIIDTRHRVSNDRVEQKNFAVFKSVAVNMRCSFAHQRRAWMKHEELLQETIGEAVFMRTTQVLDAAYFRQLLASTRENPVET